MDQGTRSSLHQMISVLSIILRSLVGIPFINHSVILTRRGDLVCCSGGPTILALSRERRESHARFGSYRRAPLVGLQRLVMPISSRESPIPATV